MPTPITFHSNSKISARNQKMYEMRQKGKTLEEIGELFSISRERVRQICDKLENRAPETDSSLDPKTERIVQDLGITCLEDFDGVSYSEILAVDAVGVSTVRNLEEVLLKNDIHLVQDVDLKTYRKNPYKKVTKKKKPGPKSATRKR